jgi:predicted DNA-binding protein (UPF0251 family)
MHVKFTKTAVVVLAGIAVFGGSAVAIAGTGSSDPRQALINDAAKRLGVQPSALDSALRSAAIDQLEAAVKSGKLTQAQADEIKKHLQSGSFYSFAPGSAGPFQGHLGGGPDGHHSAALTAAAKYLGISEETLGNQLRSGKSLADLAKAHDKSAQGLYNAMAAAVKTELVEAVKDGRLTQAQADAIVKSVQAGGFPMLPGFGRPGGFGEHGDDHRFGGDHHMASFTAAAKYLGVSEDALRQDLMSGKSLAAVAKQKGKSVTGLEQAMVAAARLDLAAAVKKGYLTVDQARRIGSEVQAHIHDIVQGSFQHDSSGQPLQQQPDATPTALTGSAT